VEGETFADANTREGDAGSRSADNRGRLLEGSELEDRRRFAARGASGVASPESGAIVLQHISKANLCLKS
jgi:hypothetical protein